MRIQFGSGISTIVLRTHLATAVSNNRQSTLLSGVQQVNGRGSASNVRV